MSNCLLQKISAMVLVVYLWTVFSLTFSKVDAFRMELWVLFDYEAGLNSYLALKHCMPWVRQLCKIKTWGVVLQTAMLKWGRKTWVMHCILNREELSCFLPCIVFQYDLYTFTVFTLGFPLGPFLFSCPTAVFVEHQLFFRSRLYLIILVVCTYLYTFFSFISFLHHFITVTWDVYFMGLWQIAMLVCLHQWIGGLYPSENLLW